MTMSSNQSNRVMTNDYQKKSIGINSMDFPRLTSGVQQDTLVRKDVASIPPTANRKRLTFGQAITCALATTAGALVKPVQAGQSRCPVGYHNAGYYPANQGPWINAGPHKEIFLLQAKDYCNFNQGVFCGMDSQERIAGAHHAMQKNREEIAEKLLPRGSFPILNNIKVHEHSYGPRNHWVVYKGDLTYCSPDILQ